MKDNFSRKQKIKQKSQDYRRPQGAKRETEADKIRRMQLERIKKTPITVTVGDETTYYLANANYVAGSDYVIDLLVIDFTADWNGVEG